MRRYLLTVESINDDDLTKLVNRLRLLPQRVLLRIPIQEQDGEMDKPGSGAVLMWHAHLARDSRAGRPCHFSKLHQYLN
jgi:hypothetical protein